MKRTVLFFLFLLITVFNAAAQPDVKTILSLPPDTTKIIALNAAAKSFLKLNKGDSALFCNQQAIDLALKIKSFDKMVDAYDERQKIYTALSDKSNALNALMLSLNKCRELKYKAGVSSSCRNIALYYFRNSKFQEAIHYANWGLANGDSAKDPVRYMSLLNNLGTCNSNLGKLEEASHYLLRALRIAESVRDTFRVAAICNNISQLYNRIGDIGKVKEYAFKSIAYLSRFDTIGLKHPYSNLAFVYLEREYKYDSALYYSRKAAVLSKVAGDLNLLGTSYQQIAVIYRRMQLPDSSDYYINLALKTGYEDNNDETISVALSFISASLIRKGKSTGNRIYFKEALEKLNESLKHAELSESSTAKEIAYQNLVTLYNESGDYKNAYLYKVKFDAFKDSMLNKEIVNNTAKLEAKYLSEKSEREIAENKIALQQKDLEITKKTSSNRLLIAGLSLLVILLLFGTITFVQRQKLAKREKEFEKHKAIEQTRAAIASDLHDDIGSTLSSVQFMSSFAMQAIDSSSPDAKQWVQKIETNTGDLLQNIRDIVWTLNPENDNASDLILRMKQFATELLEPKNIEYNFNISEAAEQYLESLIAKRNVFLIYKEVLTNAAKYSEARQVNISMELENQKLKLVISDVGKGFDANELTSGNGIKNIKKRAESLNGAIAISSTENEGTTVVLTC